MDIVAVLLRQGDKSTIAEVIKLNLNVPVVYEFESEFDLVVNIKNPKP